ncbi:MAG: Flp family type IVb pilin, partial [Terriglobales bacterium]
RGLGRKSNERCDALPAPGGKPGRRWVRQPWFDSRRSLKQQQFDPHEIVWLSSCSYYIGRHSRFLYSTEGEQTMTALMSRMWNDDGGQDMAEYAIMLGVIAAVVIGAITLLGTNISTEIKNIAGKVIGS